MNWTIDSRSSAHMVRVALSGDFDLKEFLHMLEDVGQAMKAGPVRKVLFDDRSLNMKDVTFYDQLDDAIFRRIDRLQKIYDRSRRE